MEGRIHKIKVDKIATLSGHSDCVYALEGAPDEKKFYSGSGDGMVAEWDLEHPEDGTLAIKVETSVYALHLRKDLNRLFVGQNFKGIHAINLENKKEEASSSFTEHALFDIVSHEQKLIAGSGEGQVTILSAIDLTTLAKLNFSRERVRSLAIHITRNELAVGYSDNFIRVFDLDSYELKKEWQAHENSVFKVIYSPDGDFLFSTGRDAHINVWDIKADYARIESIPAHMYAINDIAFRKDGKFFATCSMDKSIKIWSTDTLKLLKVIDKSRHAGHGTSVNKLFWSNYHNQLVSCSDDRSISIWDIQIKDN